MVARRPRRNRIKECALRGERALGVNVQTGAPEVVEIAGACGYDYVMLDMEHGAFGFETVVNMIRAAEAYDITPIVRIPHWQDLPSIRRCLDAGAMGVIIPNVQTVEQAEPALSCCRYFDGQFGDRGACPMIRATDHLTTNWAEFARLANDSIYVALAIESTVGIENLSSLSSLRGVDALFLGSFDLSVDVNYGGELSNPVVQRHIAALKSRAAIANVPLHLTLMGGTRGDVDGEVDVAYQENVVAINVIADRRLLAVDLARRLDVAKKSLHPSP